MSYATYKTSLARSAGRFSTCSGAHFFGIAHFQNTMSSHPCRTTPQSSPTCGLVPSFLPFKHWFFFNQCFLFVYPVKRNKKVRLFRVVKPLLLLFSTPSLLSTYLVRVRMRHVRCCFNVAFGGYHDSKVKALSTLATHVWGSE